jgi:hypothetical protein
MSNQTQLAFQLLKIELQLKAYQKLHHEELAQLWENLDACKQTIAAMNDVPVKVTTLRTSPDENNLTDELTEKKEE